MCNLSLEKESQLIKDWSPSTSQVRPPGPPGAIFYLHRGDFCQPANFSLDYSTFCPDLLAHSRERPNLSCKQRSRTLHICTVFSAIEMSLFLPTYLFPLKSVITLILTLGSDCGMRMESFVGSVLHIWESWQATDLWSLPWLARVLPPSDEGQVKFANFSQFSSQIFYTIFSQFSIPFWNTAVGQRTW